MRPQLFKSHTKHSFVALIGMIAFAANTSMASPKCSNTEFCGDQSYDYRGQSSFGKLSPGDTTRLKVVLYSNNDVRIALCADDELKKANFKVIKTIREYTRIVDRVEKKTTEIPIYKTNRKGEKIPQKSSNGTILKDSYGDIVYEVEKYRNVELTDTIWKTVRNIREEIIFDSASDQEKSYYEETIQRTTSVIIEVAVPPFNSQAKEEQLVEGCVGILVGRKPTNQ